MLPDCERYEKVTEALRIRFKPVDIEELRGLEFHHHMQGSETIEESCSPWDRRPFHLSLAVSLMAVEGTIFQALHVKWKRKLGAPKTDESFKDLYDRARILEQHEEEYAESAANRGGGESQKRGERTLRSMDKSGSGGRVLAPSVKKAVDEQSVPPLKTSHVITVDDQAIYHVIAQNEGDKRKHQVGIRYDL